VESSTLRFCGEKKVIWVFLEKCTGTAPETSKGTGRWVVAGRRVSSTGWWQGRPGPKGKSAEDDHLTHHDGKNLGNCTTAGVEHGNRSQSRKAQERGRTSPK